MATINQMRARALSGHYLALERIAKGESPFTPMMRAGEINGMRTVVETLERWEAITRQWLADERRNQYGITEIGRTLLRR